MRINPFRLFLPLVSLGLLAARAQNPAAGADQVTVSFSRSADNDLTSGGSALGEVGVNATSVTWRSALPLTEATRLNYGLKWDYLSFSRPATSAVPETLQEIAVVVGATHRLNDAWSLTALVSPGLYGDLEGGNSDAFNAPVLLLAHWRRSSTLAWTFGLRADGFADRPVLPFVGLNWRFAPAWEFSLGVPRAGFTYTVSPALELGLGVSLQGGNYHVGRDPRPVSIAVGSRLDDTKLDYHEIRVGLAADWKLNKVFSLTAEAGVITDQKFDYFDRDYVVDGGRTGYCTIGFTGRF